MNYYKYFLSVLLMLSVGLQAQLNEYKYIIVPKKFDTFKNENQHQTSTLIKYLFSQKGFNTVYQGDFPEDLKENLCLGATVNLVDESTLFRTKTILVLKDCELNEIFKTIPGTSKIKEFKKSYNEAIRRAFESFDIVEYAYTPKEAKKESKEETVTLNFKNDVKSLKEDKVDKQPILEQIATTEEQQFKNRSPVESNIQKAETSSVEKKVSKTILYAQPIENGYQLVDSTPKIRYKILSTSADGVYLVEGDDIANGLIFKKEGKWMLEGTQTDGSKIKKELEIKF